MESSHCRLGVAKATDADTYEQHPMKTRERATAVATLKKNPFSGDLYDFIPRAQLFWGRSCFQLFFGVIAPLACLVLKSTCVGCRGDFGTMAPLEGSGEAPVALTEFRGSLRV